MEHVVDGRKKFFREGLTEVFVRLVERQLLDADHALGANEPQPEHERLKMSKLEVVERFGEVVLAGLALERGDLQLVDFLGQRLGSVAADERESGGGDLQEVEEAGDVRNFGKFRFELNSDRGRRDGVELRDLCPEFCPSVSSKSLKPIVEARNAGVVDQGFAADEPVLFWKKKDETFLNWRCESVSFT